MEHSSIHTIEKTDRIMSVISGATMLYSEFNKVKSSKIKMALAGYLIYRGLSGHCFLSDKIGINSSVLSKLTGRF